MKWKFEPPSLGGLLAPVTSCFVLLIVLTLLILKPLKSLDEMDEVDSLIPCIYDDASMHRISNLSEGHQNDSFFFLGTNNDIPNHALAQVIYLQERDTALRGACRRNGLNMSIFFQGVRFKIVPLSNEGCADHCYLVNRLEDAQVIYGHLPDRWYHEQKILLLNFEPRLVGAFIWTPRFKDLANAMMTYNLDSNVPNTYLYPNFFQDAKKNGIPTLENFKSRKFMIFVSSNCARKRTQTVKKLMTYLQIDARGRCLNNAPIIKGHFLDNIPVYRQYKFVIGFEKSVDQDYVSEKFVLGFLGNSVPVYTGSKTARLFAPGNDSFIDMTMFPSVKCLAQYLLEVGSDYHKWKRYFQYTQEPTPDWKLYFERWTGLHPSGLCRVCDCLCDNDCASSPNPGDGIQWEENREND